MTAKEKAKELVSKFSDVDDLGLSGHYEGTWEWSEEKWMYQSKQCALIAIDTALEFLGGASMDEEFDKVLYLFEVKAEIEKL